MTIVFINVNVLQERSHFPAYSEARFTKDKKHTKTPVAIIPEIQAVPMIQVIIVSGATLRAG